MEFEFITKLASNKVKKVRCPKCQQNKKWQRYINIDTGEILHDSFGKCDRVDSCGYELNPEKEPYYYSYNYFKGLDIQTPNKDVKFLRTQKKHLKMINIPKEVLKETLNCNHSNNTFTNYLFDRCNHNTVNSVLNAYYVGSVPGYNTSYKKGVCFSFVSYDGKVRAIQVKTFNDTNNTIDTTFYHQVIANTYGYNKDLVPKWIKPYTDSDNKVSCFFGEHLLKKYVKNPIVLVESPKTAIYLSILQGGIPKKDSDILYLASFSLQCFKVTRCKHLQHRKVLLCADTSKDNKCFDMWENESFKINKTYPTIDFKMSKLIDSFNPGNGMDLGDFIPFSKPYARRKEVSKESYSTLVNKNLEPFTYREEKERFNCIDDIATRQSKYNDVSVLFDNLVYIPDEYKSSSIGYISDVKKFIESHINMCNGQAHDKVKRPYLDRLILLHKELSK